MQSLTTLTLLPRSSDPSHHAKMNFVALGLGIAAAVLFLILSAWAFWRWYRNAKFFKSQKQDVEMQAQTVPECISVDRVREQVRNMSGEVNRDSMDLGCAGG
jgi:hypothetical protein